MTKNKLPTRKIKPIFIADSEIGKFLSLVSKVPTPVKGCLEWQGAFEGKYGLHAGTGAHRVAFFVEHRRQPKGGVVRHSCDNPPCCNPQHLLEGTQKDNMQDCIQRGRFKASRKGSKNLTQEQVRRIIESKTPAKILAREIGCKKQNIWRIRREWRQQQAQ